MSAETRTTSSTGGEKGVKLQRFDLIPVGPLTELAEHYGVGASKYADNQWRQGYEWSKSYAAMMRHFTTFWAGFDYDVCSNDPEGCSHVDAKGQPFVAIREDACFNHTGSHHLVAGAWHAFGLLEFKDGFPEHDDRYRPEPETVSASPYSSQVQAPPGGFAKQWVADYDAIRVVDGDGGVTVPLYLDLVHRTEELRQCVEVMACPSRFIAGIDWHDSAPMTLENGAEARRQMNEAINRRVD